MEAIAGESPSAVQLTESLSDPADADVAYKQLWNVRARSWASHAQHGGDRDDELEGRVAAVAVARARVR